MSDFDRHIGGNFRSLRLAAGLAQEDVARRLGVTFQQIQKYEKGSNRLPLRQLLEARALFAVPLTEFFAGLSAGLTGFDGNPAAELPVDRTAQTLYRRLAKIKDPALKKKIMRVVDILLRA